MEKINYKKHIRIFLLLSAVLLMGCMLMVIVIDPFFQYHKPLQGVSYTIDNQLSQNPGMARNFDYDSVILGSSMTVNFNTDVFAQTMGLNTLKLSYNGAYPKDIDNIMSIVQGSHNQVREVFLGIDIYIYEKTPGITAYDHPEYLWDDSVWNDLPYLLNKDVLLEYILRNFVTGEPGTPLNEVYHTWDYAVCGKESVLATYTPPREFAAPLPPDCYIGNLEKSMDSYIIPYIESMPDTHFTVFFPPYSVLYWYTRFAEGSLEAEIQGEKYIMDRLLAYPNVSVYYFQNIYEFITNLDYYADYTHYTHEMNDYMARCFGDGTYQLTEESYEKALDELLTWLSECDFESYLQ